MATVEKIIPCVCTDHEPTVGDGVHYGMPQLKVSCGTVPHKQFWTPFCPVCGRGGILEYGSPYQALKAWNQLQTELRVGNPFEAEEEKL